MGGGTAGEVLAVLFSGKEIAVLRGLQGRLLTRTPRPTRVERHCSHIIELSPRQLAGRDFAANEGVRIFTVKRVSGSFLGIKLMSVRTRCGAVPQYMGLGEAGAMRFS